MTTSPDRTARRVARGFMPHSHAGPTGFCQRLVGFSAAGSLGGGGPSTELGVRCLAGPDQKINVLDACDFYFDSSGASGHVIPCSLAPSLP